jgi:hypothetical protein
LPPVNFSDKDIVAVLDAARDCAFFSSTSLKRRTPTILNVYSPAIAIEITMYMPRGGRKALMKKRRPIPNEERDCANKGVRDMGSQYP